MSHTISRRQALLSTLFGAGFVGLRALATGIPASVLLRGRGAFAGPAPAACVDRAKAQFIILSTSSDGDPINANVPGTYEDARIAHSKDAALAATPMRLGAVATTAALPWTQIEPAVLARTSFWHLMTNTPVHPKQPDVLKLMGLTASGEMLPSLLATQLAPCLGTVQAQPITLGASTPSEGLSYAGQALPIIPPMALKATLTSPSGPLANLQAGVAPRCRGRAGRDRPHRRGVGPWCSRASVADAGAPAFSGRMRWASCRTGV